MCYIYIQYISTYILTYFRQTFLHIPIFFFVFRHFFESLCKKLKKKGK